MIPQELARTWQLISTNGDPCINPDGDSNGFYGLLQRTEIDFYLRDLMPSACDRFEEARFFVQLLMSLEVCEANRDAANWCLGAHLAAYIGIHDAAKHDFGRNFKKTPLQKEFWLTSNNPDPFARDPVAINKLYRDLRNLRTHFGERLLEAATTMQLADVGANRQSGLHRWYLRHLKTLNFGRLDTRNFSEFEMQKFAEFYKNKPVVAILCQNLYVMAKAINESAASSSPN